MLGFYDYLNRRQSQNVTTFATDRVGKEVNRTVLECAAINSFSAR